jgi:hypothetical protein
MGSDSEYLAECYWPDVGETELRALDERARVSSEAVTAQGHPVRYLGSLRMRTDEVVLCLFAGSLDAVRQAATQAEVPYDRIVETDRSPWPVTETK